MSKIKLVMGRGANASGKTTIAKDLINISSDIEVGMWTQPLFEWDADHYPRVFATIMRDIGWACIGSYPKDKKMGGCDTLGGCESTYKAKRAIADVLNMRGRLKGIYWEGMMISTVISTPYEFMMSLKPYDVDPYFVVFNATLEGCLQRIKDRGTSFGKTGANEQNIADKCNRAIDTGHKLEQLGGIPVKWLDVEHTPREYMLTAFLNAINWELK
jgi:hypothetical protein